MLARLSLSLLALVIPTWLLAQENFYLFANQDGKLFYYDIDNEELTEEKNFSFNTEVKNLKPHTLNTGLYAFVKQNNNLFKVERSDYGITNTSKENLDNLKDLSSGSIDLDPNNKRLYISNSMQKKLEIWKYKANWNKDQNNDNELKRTKRINFSDITDDFQFTLDLKRKTIYYQNEIGQIKSYHIKSKSSGDITTDAVNPVSHLQVDYRNERIYWLDTITKEIKSVSINSGEITIHILGTSNTLAFVLDLTLQKIIYTDHTTAKVFDLLTKQTSNLLPNDNTIGTSTISAIAVGFADCLFYSEYLDEIKALVAVTKFMRRQCKGVGKLVKQSKKAEKQIKTMIFNPDQDELNAFTKLIFQQNKKAIKKKSCDFSETGGTRGDFRYINKQLFKRAKSFLRSAVYDKRQLFCANT